MIEQSADGDRYWGISCGFVHAPGGDAPFAQAITPSLELRRLLQPMAAAMV